MKIYSSDYFYKRVLPYSKEEIQQSIKLKDYRSFSIPKKGGQRTISYLDETSRLNVYQKCLVNNLFFDEPFPICVRGFIKGESYRTFLEPHIGKVYYLRIDIHDFFGSITKEKVKTMLDSMIFISNIKEKNELIDLISELLTLNDKLPQGAASSPIVSNLCFRRIDQRITKYCQEMDITYTRYADDILFSSHNFDFNEKKWFLRKIRKILRSDSYVLNYSKIKYGSKELCLSGFVIGPDVIRLSRKRLKDIKRILFFIIENKDKILDEEDYISRINTVGLLYRKEPFVSYNHIIQYINGYRAFLISYIDNWNFDSNSQKEIRRIIYKCEKCVNIIYSNK